MRVLHTSDWHLGRVFHGVDLLSEQRRALGRVVEIARDHAVDVVLVAGDLYDRAIPPADAVDLLADALRELRGLVVPVVAITGNHDSPNRVGALDPLLRAGGVTLRGRFDPSAPVVVPSTDGGPDLVVHPIPYLEPLAAPLVEGQGRRRRPTHHELLAAAVEEVRTDLAARGPVRSAVVAHAFVAGGAPSSSERELAVGGVDRVPVSTFDGVDLVALGHLHRPQELTDRVAYSGSLLPYSFSETGPASVRVVELAPDGSVEAEVVELGCERGVATIQGRLDSLLADPAHAPAESAWVRVRLTDEVLPRLAMDRLRDRFPHAVVLEHVAPRAVTPVDDLRRSSEPVSDLDLASAFLAERLGRPVDGDELALLRAAFDAVDADRGERVERVVATAGVATTGSGSPGSAEGLHEEGAVA